MPLDLEQIKRLREERRRLALVAPLPENETDALIERVEELEAEVKRLQIAEENADIALREIVIYGDMADGEAWAVAFNYVVEVARTALSENQETAND